MINNYKEEHIEWLKETRKLLLNKLFDLSFEEKQQRRWMLLEPNKKIIIQGQEIQVGNYVNSLGRDIKNIENRIKLADDLLAELK